MSRPDYLRLELLGREDSSRFIRLDEKQDALVLNQALPQPFQGLRGLLVLPRFQNLLDQLVLLLQVLQILSRHVDGRDWVPRQEICDLVVLPWLVPDGEVILAHQLLQSVECPFVRCAQLLHWSVIRVQEEVPAFQVDLEVVDPEHTRRELCQVARVVLLEPCQTS